MTPLFHHKSEEEKAADQARAQAREQAEQRSQEIAAASLARIEEGRIPVTASERLSALASSLGSAPPSLGSAPASLGSVPSAPGSAPSAPGSSPARDRDGSYGDRESATGTPAFSSDLSINEFSALARLGIVPITQVMGSSIFHVGWQPTYYNVPTEVRVISDAYNRCRSLALGRLLEEAQTCGADAVVGVNIDEGAHDWAPGSVEFIAMGTAVRLPEKMRHPGTQPVLSDLSGQEYSMLCQAGIRPVGIAAHTSVHYIPATMRTAMAQSAGWGSSWVNQELVDFTQGVYDAREKAIALVAAQVRNLGGDGIIGVALRQSARTHAVKRGMYDTTDMEVTFHVMGTVILEDPTLLAGAPEGVDAASQTAMPILSLR